MERNDLVLAAALGVALVVAVGPAAAGDAVAAAAVPEGAHDAPVEGAASAPAGGAASAPAEDAAGAARGGMRIHADPDTGKLLDAPSPKALPPRGLPRPDYGKLTTEEIPGVGLMLHTNGQIRMAARVESGADGTVAWDCTRAAEDPAVHAGHGHAEAHVGVPAGSDAAEAQ